MHQKADDSRTTRTVTVRLSSGETDYWLTDQVFAVGDTLRHKGRVWVVAEVVQESGNGGYPTVRLSASG
jgi:hypothetical protein